MDTVVVHALLLDCTSQKLVNIDIFWNFGGYFTKRNLSQCMLRHHTANSSPLEKDYRQFSYIGKEVPLGLPLWERSTTVSPPLEKGD